MTCPRCRHPNPVDALFCQECGARLEVGCPRCGTGNRLGANFCTQCGQRLDGAGVQEGVPGSRYGSVERYTPRHLAEKILRSRSALEGERKHVTVLFADLKGSLELLADRDPEEARHLLDPVLERMMEAVHHYEGTVNQVMGDGIMALFGAPLAHEDHAVRACYAALRMQRRVGVYSDELRRSGRPPVYIRVGVNSGEVVVRAIGSDLHMDYTAVGQTTHLAARMEQIARPGSAVVTAETLNLVEGYVEVRPLGMVPVKGLDTPAAAYELTGVTPVRSRVQAGTARGLTRFVGRESEVAQMGRALERAAAGRGQVLAIVGEAGVGKSRLAWEFTRSPREHGWLVLEGGAASFATGTPYFAVIELLKGYCRIQPRDDPRAIRERVAGKLLALDQILEPLLAPLLALLAIPVEDPAWNALDPSQRRQRTLDALKRLLLRECEAQPLLVIVEDLHWIDSETQAFLDGLVETLPTARLLLLVTYRPEYHHGWGGKTYYLQVRADPLPRDSAEALLDALLGDDPSLRSLKRMLIERTEGNPFFLEESVRTLVETNVVAGERGAYRVLKTPSGWQIPPTAQAILAARIDRLAPEDKHLLQTASVVGIDVPFALLQAVAALPEASLRQGLGRLQRAEFLYETRTFPELEYTFKHALTFDVAYGSLLQDRRRPLHARILATIEALYPERRAELVERLAHHAVRAEAWEKAVGYLREAGTKALARSANREAVAQLEQALAALSHLPVRRETLEQAVDLRFDLRNSLIPLGELDRIMELLNEAEGLAATLGDQRRLGWVATFMTNCRWHLGDHARAVESGQRALAIANAIGDLPLRVEASFRLGQAYHPLGEYRRAVRFLRESLDALPEELTRERLGGSGLLSVFSRTWLVWCLAELGEFEEAVARGEEAVRIAESVDHPYTLAHAQFGVGLVHLRRGDVVRAVAVLEPSLVLCQTANLPGPYPVVAAQLALARALSGRVAEASPLLAEVAERVGAMTLRWGNAPWLLWLGEASLLADRLEEATRIAHRVLDGGRQRNERGQQAWALWLLGELASCRDHLAEAEDRFREALALGQELGMEPLAAHCHRGLARACRARGDRAQAAPHASAATRLYRAMGMRLWLETLEREQ
jgi:class 3 adenylate cyclase/tetratricopeptide (TPR) repeat protein